MKKSLIPLIILAIFLSCGEDEVKNWQKQELPGEHSLPHILSINVKDDSMLVGTFGNGAFFSSDNGANWTVFDTSGGLLWNFILGGDWQDDYFILATLGDGLNISKDNGESWERFGYNFFGIEYLYTVGAKIVDGRKYVPTADGLIVFDEIRDWKAFDEGNGMGSQYIYDMKIDGGTIVLGTLHGLSISRDYGENWTTISPDGKYALERFPACKVRAVEFSGRTIYAGCDDGLFVSSDEGKSWKPFGKGHLKSRFIRDLFVDNELRLWIATYNGVAIFNIRDKTWRIYDTGNGLPRGGVNCIAVTDAGDVYAGTNYGLYKLTPGVAHIEEERRVDAEFLAPESPKHQWMLRPVSPEYQNQKDQTYLYGSTMGGNFRQHQGNEYNSPEGTPLLAVDDGTIVYIDKEIGHSVLRCDRKQGEYFVYAHYHHQNEIFKRVGDKVKRGELIGSVGKKGNVTNEHLHFEVSLSKIDDSNRESDTRNPELWVEPLPGTGTIAGSVKGPNGVLLPGVRVYGVTKPVPTETPFSFAETYGDKVHPDESYNENFVIGDVPEGEYILFSETDSSRSAVRVLVKAGMVTRVRLALE